MAVKFDKSGVSISQEKDFYCILCLRFDQIIAPPPAIIDTMEPELRRSRRRAYVSLAALEARAKAVATTEEQEAFWGEGAVDEPDDDSFDENDTSDSGKVGSLTVMDLTLYTCFLH